MQTQIQTAILPVAGRGTRLLPATKSVPKEMLPVYDRPLLQYAICEAREAGIKRLVLVTDQSKAAIQHYFERDTALRASLEASGKAEIGQFMDRLDPTDDMQVFFVYQNEPLGLGHAILCAKDVVDPDAAVAVILPDDLILGNGPAIAEMARAYDRGQAAHMLGAQVVPREDVGKYGICDSEAPMPGQHVRIKGMVEKPEPADAPSELAIVGRYILGPEIFEALEKTVPGAGGEIQLTDAIATEIDGHGVRAFHLTGTRFDCGHADGLLAASQAVQARSQANKRVSSGSDAPATAA